MASDEDETTPETTTGRRGLVRWGAPSTAAAMAASLASANRAAAATGSPAVTGQTNNFGNTQTGFVHNGTAQNGPGLNAFRTAANTTSVQYGENAGLIAETQFTDNDGVIGFCAGGANSSGVHGFSFDGRGVVGSGDTGVGVLGEIRVGNSGAGSVAVKATKSQRLGAAVPVHVPGRTTGGRDWWWLQRLARRWMRCVCPRWSGRTVVGTAVL